MRATVPDGGVLEAISRIETRVTTAGAEEFTVEAVQTVQADGLRDGRSRASFSVSRKGRLSRLSSPQLDHPVRGACVRDLAFLFMTLPAGPVDPGSSWATLRTVYMPELDLPVTLPPIELAITCKLAAFEGPPDRPVARIDLTAKPAPGMPEGGNVTGVYRLDVNRGRVLSGSLRGMVNVRILLMELEVPFEVDVFEDQEPPVPPGTGAR